MAKFDDNRFSSDKQEYETPDELFNAVNSVFHFTIDVCADESNAKCKDYWTAHDNALEMNWKGICWMNPPYNAVGAFVKKAYEQRSNSVTVCLIPARTNTTWWHNYCMNGEMYFIKGRPKFKGCKHGLPQPLALVVFGRDIGVVGSFDMKTMKFYIASKGETV